jgi:hypothetical protein
MLHGLCDFGSGVPIVSYSGWMGMMGLAIFWLALSEAEGNRFISADWVKTG